MKKNYKNKLFTPMQREEYEELMRYAKKMNVSEADMEDMKKYLVAEISPSENVRQEKVKEDPEFTYIPLSEREKSRLENVLYESEQYILNNVSDQCVEEQMSEMGWLRSIVQQGTYPVRWNGFEYSVDGKEKICNYVEGRIVPVNFNARICISDEYRIGVEKIEECVRYLSLIHI